MSLQSQTDLWDNPSSAHKSWCFTINNYTKEDEKFIYALSIVTGKLNAGS